MRILIAGDLHGIPRAASRLVDTARAVEADEVWQAGDFGFWPKEPTFKAFMEILGESPAPIYFADGNHEDHHALESGRGHMGPKPVWDNIWHQPRGTVREVAGKRVLFFGGAQSVDETHRHVNVSWFREELPTALEWAHALDKGKVDVVVAHEAPTEVDFGYPPHDQAFWPTEVLERATRFREQLQEHLLPSADPELWFHGHHHKMKHTVAGDGRRDIYSLNCDGLTGAFALYYTESGAVEFVRTRETTKVEFVRR